MYNNRMIQKRLKSTLSKTGNHNKPKSNLMLLQGSSLEDYNEFLRKLLSERGISANLKFNLEKLQQFINQEKAFGPCFCSF